MHEWSLASGIIETVSDEYEKQNASSVRQIDILVGEISQIEIDVLEDALGSLKAGTVVEKSEINIQTEKTDLKCRQCGNVFGFEQVREQLEPLSEGGDNPVHYLPESIAAFAGCPRCGGPDLEVLSGRGVRISKMIMDVED